MTGFEPANCKRSGLKSDAVDRLATYAQKGSSHRTHRICVNATIGRTLCTITNSLNYLFTIFIAIKIVNKHHNNNKKYNYYYC